LQVARAGRVRLVAVDTSDARLQMAHAVGASRSSIRARRPSSPICAFTRGAAPTW